MDGDNHQLPSKAPAPTAGSRVPLDSPPAVPWQPSDRWIVLALTLGIFIYGWFAQWRQFAYWADPVLYLAGAESIAEHARYRQESHLGQPAITLYPPIQSTWLALFWKLNPNFPENIPTLNAGMILLAAAAAAAGYAFMRARGIPPGFSSLAIGLWSTSPKWFAFIYWLSSDIGFTAWCIALGWIWAAYGAHGRSPRLWLVTGIGLALGFWWRSAALGLLAGTGLVTFWILLRERRWNPILSFGIPAAVAVLSLKLFTGPGPGYLSIWKIFIRDMGGWPGYFANFARNLAGLLRGVQFWEMLCAPALRIEQLVTQKLPFAGWIISGSLALVFWAFLACVVRGFFKRSHPMDRALVPILSVYLAQIMVTPFSAEHWHRYLYVLLPLLFTWAWLGWPQSLPARLLAFPTIPPTVRNFPIAAACLLAFAANLHKTRNDRRYIEALFPVPSVHEIADWTRNHTPTNSVVAIDFRLPVTHFQKRLGRPILMDPFHPTALTSPISHDSQSRQHPDFLVIADRGAEPYTPPAKFEELYRTQDGIFRLFKVRD